MNGIINTPPPLMGYDVVIRTNLEFARLIASPDWLGTESVLFDGRFSISTAIGIEIPLTVKRIGGHPGSIIDIVVSEAVPYVFGRRSVSHEPCRIDGITLGITVMQSDSCQGFYNCTNLTDCHVILRASDPGAIVYGFSYCAGLVGCTVKTERTIPHRIYAFSNCRSLTGCHAHISSLAGACSAYTNCGTMSGCRGNVYNITNCDIFSRCSLLSGCSAESSADSSGSVAFITCFETCNHLSSCIAKIGINDDGGGNGFSNCSDLSSCYAQWFIAYSSSGIVPYAESLSFTPKGYAFLQCYDLASCSGVSPSEDGIFKGCNGLVNCRDSDVWANNGFILYDCSHISNCYCVNPKGILLGGTNTKVDDITVG